MMAHYTAPPTWALLYCISLSLFSSCSSVCGAPLHHTLPHPPPPVIIYCPTHDGPLHSPTHLSSFILHVPEPFQLLFQCVQGTTILLPNPHPVITLHCPTHDGPLPSPTHLSSFVLHVPEPFQLMFHGMQNTTTLPPPSPPSDHYILPHP